MKDRNVIFITTPTLDCFNHVQAFRSFHPCHHVVMYPHRGVRLDDVVVDQALALEPDLIFYIGANQGQGALPPARLKELRSYAPTVNLCSDAADRPWHGVLAAYAERGCFDAQVSIDGAKPTNIDIASLTPIDPAPFDAESTLRDFRCGFSGSPGKYSPRGEIIYALTQLGGLTLRTRTVDMRYEAHAEFMNNCRMILNTAWTGTGRAFHIKGRVLEAGWAGCALLEQEGSPFEEWFPKGSCFFWRDAKEAAAIIAVACDYDINSRAELLAKTVREKYSPEKIYGEITDYVDNCGIR